MAKRYILEGTWSGYASSQSRVVHKVIISEKKAKEIEKHLPSIRYTDGTSLYLRTLPAKKREQVQEIHGYDGLIADCLSQGVNNVEALRK